jgi:hypothetical protein
LSVLTTVNQITTQTATYAPALVLAAQAAGGTGQEKQSAVVRVLTGIEVGSGALENSPNPTVASVALLVNMLVSLFKALRHPSFVAPAPTA